MNYIGTLGRGFLITNKPVVLFDDFSGNFTEYDTVDEALRTRDRQEFGDKFARLKKVFVFDAGAEEFVYQVGT